MGSWLATPTRSDEELAQLLRDSKSGDLRHRDHRKRDRFALRNVPGELICGRSKVPCHLLDISLSGCRVRCETRFRQGALAPVEIAFSLFGMDLHLNGETQWVKDEQQTGIRFNPLGANSSAQMDRVIARLKEQAPDVEDQFPVPPQTASVLPVKFPYDTAIHCGEGRVECRKDDEWQVLLRTPAGNSRHAGLILDLSLGGFTVRTGEPFIGIIQDYFEVEFELRGLHFLLCATATVIYNTQTVGLRFNPMALRKLEALAQVIRELGVPSTR
jgi:hypothetical protein